MIMTRRNLLAGAGAFSAWLLLAAGGLLAGAVRAAIPRSAFDRATLDDIIKDLGGSGSSESGDIEMHVPEIAENGAVVPVEVTSKLANTRSIALIVSKNPHPLSASFQIPEGTEPYISTRIKVGETADIIALVKTDAGFFTSKRLVKVTLGGCGG